MHPINLLKRVDHQLGGPLSALRQQYAVKNGMLKKDLGTTYETLLFNSARLRRKVKYPRSSFDINPYPAVVKKLDTEGFAIMEGAVDTSILGSIKNELEQHLNSGTCLSPVSRDSARRGGDRAGPEVFFSQEEVVRGQEYYRNDTNYVSIANPLVNCPSVVNVTFGDLLIDIATGYLGCLPMLGGLNLRKSFVNSIPEFDTLYFHCDKNSTKFLKFFFYLNDVDEEGGPFCYVPGSHRKKFPGWSDKYRWSNDEIASAYGDDKIVYLTGKPGDMIVANTTGFHRGTKVRSADRSMLTVDYVVHPEYWAKTPQFKISSESYGALSPKQKAAADFLEVV